MSKYRIVKHQYKSFAIYTVQKRICFIWITEDDCNSVLEFNTLEEAKRYYDACIEPKHKVVRSIVERN